MNRLIQPVLLSILICAASSGAWAVEVIEISPGATDSEVCGIVERSHGVGLEHWRANNMSGALELFTSCESILKKRSLWMPPKLPKNATPGQVRALKITNDIIFSMASLYRQMDNLPASQRYADMARERGILPKVFMAGKRGISR